jgi:phosphohistidine swiveling domain-containing protein
MALEVTGGHEVAQRFVRGFDEVDSRDLGLVGGKGARLGDLVASGIPVPTGFCITTTAYREFVQAAGILDWASSALEQCPPDDPSSLEAVSNEIRMALSEVPVPTQMTSEILSRYDTTWSPGPPPAVAVRSSATAEDLPGTSFAGQQDTYLHIEGAPALLDAVRDCWASLWTSRAIAYRQSLGFAHDVVDLAVVVQEMFPSRVSGVLFTAHPLTSNPFQCFINASWGLGEAVVSGHTDPDEIVVDHDSLRVVSYRIGEKAVATVPDPAGQGTITQDTPLQDRQRRVLDDAVAHLCRIGLEIAAEAGFPQDIEWGWANGHFAVLQAREITGCDLDMGHELETWKTPKALASMYDERWVWSRAYSDEVQTGPSTPSFYTYLQKGMTHLKARALELTWSSDCLGFGPQEFLDIPYFRWYGARAYYNLAFERERLRRFIPPFARDAAALWPFPEEERDELRSMEFSWADYLGLLWRLHTERPDVSLLGTTAVMYEGLERWTDAEDAFWEDFDLEAADVEAIFAAQLASRRGSRFGENVVLPFTIYLFVLPQALEELCRRLFDDSSIAADLVVGLGTKTAEENVDVWNLSRRVRHSDHLRTRLERAGADGFLRSLDDHPDATAFAQEFAEFIRHHGHRGGAERDAYHPRWRHRPELAVAAFAPLVQLDDDDGPVEREEALRARMKATRADCLERLRNGPSGDETARFFDWFVDLVRDHLYYRDFERYYNDKTMCRSRDLYQAIARRFIAAGLLDEPDDVFFLGREEMLAADRGELDARTIAIRIGSRRRVYERYRYREPPKYLCGWRAFDDPLPIAGDTLNGIPASSGIVTGRARVCRDLSDIGRLERGDVLVTVATDPGWTMVFTLIGGVVVETGGVVAHAVMISREYGLPCVSNLRDACSSIPDGALVTVDGSTGRVTIHPDDPNPEDPFS